jgi:FAD/FMN-containing dehydrogenase
VNRREFLVASAALCLAGCNGRRARPRPLPKPPSKRPPTLGELGSQLRGPLLRPGSSGYGAASVIENERYEIRPRAIALARDARDVAACVRFAARSPLPFAVRSGGHSYAGYCLCHGLVCDLRRLNAIRIAPDGRSVTVGAGTLAIDLITALAARGLAVPTGSCPTVGISGLALGGGLGFAARGLGATCDNLESLRIVTADAHVRTASAKASPDLYWACRGGGGGNFGAVTELTFRTHPVGTAAYGFCDFPWSEAPAVVAAWQQLAPHAADELYLICALETGSSGPTVRVFGQLLGGSESAFRAALAPLTEVTGASLSTGTRDYLDVQRIWAGCATESARACRGLRPSPFAAKSAYFDRPLSPAGVEKIVAAIENRRNGTGAVLLDPYGGAINRVAPDATAFVHRDQLYSAQLLAYWTSPTGGAQADRWLAALDRGLSPHSSRQAYQNYIDPDLAEWEQAYYGSNLPRLRDVKRQYDPDQVFRFAQSIPA